VVSGDLTVFILLFQMLKQLTNFCES